MRTSLRCLNVLNGATLFSHTPVARKLRFGGGLGHQCLDCPAAVPVELKAQIGQADHPFAIVADHVIVICGSLDLQLSTGSRVCHYLFDACRNKSGRYRGFGNSLYTARGMPVAPGKADNGECNCACSSAPKSVCVFFLHDMTFLGSANRVRPRMEPTMRVSSQASESTYVAQPPRNRGDWNWRAAQFASLRANAAPDRGRPDAASRWVGRRDEPRWLALLNGGKSCAPKGADREGNPEGRTYTSAHIGGTPNSESAYRVSRSGITQACVASVAR